jgi:hypothetical protein
MKDKSKAPLVNVVVAMERLLTKDQIKAVDLVNGMGRARAVRYLIDLGIKAHDEKQAAFNRFAVNWGSDISVEHARKAVFGDER